MDCKTVEQKMVISLQIALVEQMFSLQDKWWLKQKRHGHSNLIQYKQRWFDQRVQLTRAMRSLVPRGTVGDDLGSTAQLACRAPFGCGFCVWIWALAQFTAQDPSILYSQMSNEAMSILSSCSLSSPHFELESRSLAWPSLNRRGRWIRKVSEDLSVRPRALYCRKSASTCCHRLVLSSPAIFLDRTSVKRSFARPNDVSVWSLSESPGFSSFSQLGALSNHIQLCLSRLPRIQWDKMKSSLLFDRVGVFQTVFQQQLWQFFPENIFV